LQNSSAFERLKLTTLDINNYLMVADPAFGKVLKCIFSSTILNPADKVQLELAAFTIYLRSGSN
jgi:hypothetical protein